MPPKILSRSGCWTCRVRHKKCDEVRPECNECTLRSLTCHGYHQKPHFIDDPDLLHLEISRIKKTVKEVYRRKRRLLLRKTASSDDQCDSEPKGNEADALSPEASSPELTGPDSWNVDGNAESVYREAELTMYYLDRIFPILFPYCQWDPADGGRGWLFWLLSQDVPLRQAALSLAALHQRANSSGIKSDETELLEYHTNALSGLRRTLQYTSEANLINDMVKLTHLMACGCSLISFEVCQGESEQWQAHLEALVSVARHLDPAKIACIATPKADGQSPMARVTASDRHKSSLEMGRKLALRFFVAQVLWNELLACASTGNEPRMPYHMWLNADCINMVDLMGCEHWALEVIGDIALLDARTSQLLSEQIMETIADCEHRLERGIDALEAKKACHEPKCASFSESDGQRRQLRTYYVTLAFATTAKLLLILAKLATSSSEHHAGENVHTLVDHIIAILTQAAEMMSLRGLVWPICISGSLANAAQQKQIRSIMEAVVSSGDTSFGNCGSIMSVLAHCWRNKTGDQDKPWRAAMAEMGHYVLLI